jgi:hypothetical protein
MSKPKKLLSTEELAERWNVSVGYLTNQRSKEKGCTYIKIGSMVRYPLEAIEAYESRNSVTPSP